MGFLKQLQLMAWLIVDFLDQMLPPLNDPPFSALVYVNSALKQSRASLNWHIHTHSLPWFSLNDLGSQLVWNQHIPSNPSQVPRVIVELEVQMQNCHHASSLESAGEKTFQSYLKPK